jgi:hypothetical protein
MPPLYSTDRESGPPPRPKETIEKSVWGGICALVGARLADDSFGYRFPEGCPDGYGISGYNDHMLNLTIAAEILPLLPATFPTYQHRELP